MTLQSNGVALEIEGDSEVPQQQLFRSPAAMCDAKIRRCSSVLPPLCPCMSYRRVAWQTNPSTHMTVSRILVSLLNTRVTLHNTTLLLQTKGVLRNIGVLLRRS